MNTDKIRPADRLNGIGEYYLQRKMKEVADLNAAGADVVSLGIGGPDCPPSSEVVRALVDSANRADSHSYQIANGLPALRAAFARWYDERYGVTLDADSEVLPLIGSKEGILHISMTFVNPGDIVLVPNPGYPTYTSVSKLVGAEVEKYDLIEDRGWQPDFEALERLPLDRVKLMWVNYPHMPTGAAAAPGLFARLVDFARRHDIVLVNDNPYSFILNDRPESLLAVEGAKDVAIEMNSLSKSHNMAGWRMGVLASNARFVQWIRTFKSNVDSGQFRPVMEAATQALGLGDEWYSELNAVYRERRKVAERIMAALGCHIDERQQGLFLWGRIPDSETSGEAMADRVLRDDRVFITPGFIFGSNGERYVRISLCAPVERLEEALRRVTKSND